MSDSPTFWLALVIVALIIAAWLALQILGFLLKLLIFGAAVLLALAAFRSWSEAKRGAR